MESLESVFAHSIGPIRDQAIIDNLPPILADAAKIYGPEKVLEAANNTLGYPASWATSAAEFHQILDEVEKKP